MAELQDNKDNNDNSNNKDNKKTIGELATDAGMTYANYYYHNKLKTDPSIVDKICANRVHYYYGHQEQEKKNALARYYKRKAAKATAIVEQTKIALQLVSQVAV